MSALIFPPQSAIGGFPGQMLTKSRKPTQMTHAQRALSGKESRIALRAYPIMEWDLQFEWLPDNTQPFGQGRTNYLPNSEDFTTWSTQHSGGSSIPVLVFGNWMGVTAPDGTYSADRVIMDTVATSGNSVSMDVNLPLGPVPSGVPATFSFWARTNDGTTVTIEFYIYNGSGGGGITGITTAQITPQWQRVWVTAANAFPQPGGSTTSPAVRQQVYIALASSPTTSAYADLSLWGAQLELGSQPSRYIQTNGSAIRQSDFSTMLGLFTGMLGQWDTFLYQDPDFNTVTLAKFATGDGTTAAFNLTAAFQPQADLSELGAPSGLAGLPEWIQNANSLPQIYSARYGGPELLSTSSRTNLLLQSQFSSPSSPTNGALSQSAGGALAATTYYVRCTWYSSTTGEETAASAETSFAASASNVLHVAAPASPPAHATGWNVYVSNTAGGGSGAETLQATNIGTGSAWVEPTSGLISGVAYPTTSTMLNSPWNFGGAALGAIVTNSATTAPDGTGTASTFNEGTVNTAHDVFQNVTIGANGWIVASVFLKYVASGVQYVTCQLYNGGNWVQATFDILNGVVSGTAVGGSGLGVYAKMDLFGGGWWRCIIQGVVPTVTSISYYIQASNVANPTGTPSYLGTGRLFSMWGAQMESSGCNATAYIATTTAQVSNGGSDYSLTNLSTVGAVNTFQQVSFSPVRANNEPLLWTGSFFYRVRFSEDAIAPAEEFAGFWKLDSLKLEQVLL